MLIGAGLLLKTLLWWQADHVAGLCMVPIIIIEGRQALRGKACSDCRSLNWKNQAISLIDLARYIREGF